MANQPQFEIRITGSGSADDILKSLGNLIADLIPRNWNEEVEIENETLKLDLWSNCLNL